MGQVFSLDQSVIAGAESHSTEYVWPIPERREAVSGAAAHRWFLIYRWEVDRLPGKDVPQ